MDDLNKSIEQVNQLASQVGAQRGVTLQRLDTIDASSLTGQQKFTEPKIVTPTAAAGLSAQTQSLVQNYRTKAEAEAQTLQKQQETDKKGIKSIISRLSGVQSDAQQEMESAGVNDLKRELDDITSQMEATDLAYRRRIEKVQDNAQGLFGGAVDQEINRLERENARYQADLAITLSAKNRQYDTAYNIIQQKAEAETEDLKLQLDAAKFFYQENKDLLTTKEQRLFDTMIMEDERTYNDAKDLVTFKGELQLELAKKGAPTSLISQVSAATDRNAAMVLAAPYLSEVDANGFEVPTIKTINGVDMQWNSQTGQWETPTTPTQQGGNIQTAAAQANVDLITGIVNDKYLGTAVGSAPTGRISLSNLFTGGKSNFVAGVEQLRSQLTLDSLISAKARGATFGALSEGELNVLSSSASKLGTWAIKNGDGQTVGYRANAKDFKRELDKINNFAKLDYVLKGGTPADVGVFEMPDGTLATENSDGTVTILR